MPIHDWTRVEAGIFHHFHHDWITENARVLNRSLKGTDYYALAEQIVGETGPDVLTLQHPLGGKKSRKAPRSTSGGAVMLLDAPPRVRFRVVQEGKWFALKKKSVTIRHVSKHRVVAVLEILSPGNKSSQAALTALERKAQDLLTAGVHLTVVDLFPPTPRDPQGIHPLIWGVEKDDGFEFDPAKPLTCASYLAGPNPEAFVEPVAVGDSLPEMPLFLTGYEYLPVPLDQSYLMALEGVPDFWREALEGQQRRGKD